MSQGNGGDPVELPLTKADFSSDQETRWCPGCGDYAILATRSARTCVMCAWFSGS